jgi:hypothetical protein
MQELDQETQVQDSDASQQTSLTPKKVFQATDFLFKHAKNWDINELCYFNDIKSCSHAICEWNTKLQNLLDLHSQLHGLIEQSAMHLYYHLIDAHMSDALSAFLLAQIRESVRPYLQSIDLRDPFAILECILQIFLPSSPAVRSQLT